jgi:hypothetical protein
MEKKKTNKLSRTLNWYGRLKSLTDRPELDIVIIAFFAVAVAALTRFFSWLAPRYQAWCP